MLIFEPKSAPIERDEKWEAHRVDFSRDRRSGQHQASCSCGWSYVNSSLLTCQLKASIHDLTE